MVRIKYPRTPHLPWSRGGTADDVRMASVAQFAGRQVVVTEKMDGENTTLYRDGLHARSLDSGHHVSRSWVKGLQAQVGQDIPAGWRVCGENLYARHAIAYSDLASYFLVFSIWDDQNTCLSWESTVEWAALLGVQTVPLLYAGPWSRSALDGLPPVREGYVVRLADAFPFAQFSQSVAKYVAPSFRPGAQHWATQPMVPNGLSTGCG